MIDEFTETYERCVICCGELDWRQYSEEHLAWEKPSIRACEDCRKEYVRDGWKLLSPIPGYEWFANSVRICGRDEVRF